MILCLYIDKNEKERLKVKKVLEENLDIQVDICRSLEEAIEQITKVRYDIIIAEYFLPLHSAISLFGIVQSECNNIPVILFSTKQSDMKGKNGCISVVSPHLYLPKKGENPYNELLKLIRLEISLKPKRDQETNN